MRFGYPAKLATSVRGRLKRLQSGANPAELQLGHDCSIEQCTTLLGHLDSRWYQIPRRRPDAAAEAGRALRRRPAGRLLSRRAAARSTARIPRAGCRSPTRSSCRRSRAVPDYDRRARERRRRMGVGAVGRDLRAARGVGRAHSRTRGTAGCSTSSAIVRTGESVRVGSVTRVALGGDGQLGAEGQLALTLRLWSGTPVAMTLLPLSAASSDDPPLPALRLDETPDDKPTPRAAAANVQSEPGAALARRRSRSAVPADAPSAARHRLRARRVRRDDLSGLSASPAARHATACRTVSRAKRARTCCSTPRIPSTGSRGTTRRWPWRAAKASRSCCRSATRRATGAT